MGAAFGAPPLIRAWLEATIGRPGWRHYFALDGDTPVATAALYAAGPVGYLGWAATLSLYRRQGTQRALLAHRVRDGAALGCAWVTADTALDTRAQPNPSYRNIRRCGMRVAYRVPIYLYMPSTVQRSTALWVARTIHGVATARALLQKRR